MARLRTPGLPLDGPTLAAAYHYLRATPPFNGWGLPDPETISFKVDRSVDTCGWYRCDKGRHIIGISSTCIGTSKSLIEVMAHEMIHLHQRVAKTETKAMHNRGFNLLRVRVSAIHGFDPKLF